MTQAHVHFGDACDSGGVSYFLCEYGDEPRRSGRDAGVPDAGRHRRG